MNKLIKGILLFLALILPVLIFVFLKMFGENKFDIPIYNHTDISKQVSCNDIVTPHIVDELKIGNTSIKTNRVVNIYHIIDNTANESEMRGLMKVKDRLEKEDVLIHSVDQSGDSLSIASYSKKYQIGGVWQIYNVERTIQNDFINCQLMITSGESMVLVDNKGRIRGYYDGEDEEETDRLILESKILIYDTEND